MKKINLILFSVLLSLISLAQERVDFEWGHSFGGSNGDHGAAVAIDGFDNVYLGSYFNSSNVDFNPGIADTIISGSGTNDAVVQKFDSNGNLIWVRAFGNASGQSISGLVTDNNNNVFGIGYYSGNPDFDPTAGSTTIGPGADDGFVFKWNADGDFLWAKQLNSSNGCYPEAIDVDNSGNVYIAGRFDGASLDADPSGNVDYLLSQGTMDGFVIKLDGNGDYLASTSLGSLNYDAVYALTVDNNGDVFVGGVFEATVDFDNSASTDNLSSNGSWDLFVQKYNSSLEHQWVYGTGASNYDAIRAINVDSEGNVIAGGWIKNSVTFPDGGPGTTISSGSYDDLLVLKLSNNGDFIWVKNMESTSTPNYITSLEIDSEDNIYSSYVFSGTIDFDPGIAVENKSALGGTDCFMQKLDKNGDFVWVEVFGTANNEYLTNFSLDSKEDIYLTGYHINTPIDLDPSGAVNTVPNAGIEDIFIAKWDPCKANTSSFPVIACDSYTVPSGDETYTISGIYNDTIPNVDGCDSVMVIDLTINTETTATFSIESCYAYVVPSGDETYTLSGQVMDTIPNVNGCDSVMTINLIINTAETHLRDDTICKGGTYVFDDGTILNNIMANTSYTSVYPNQNGCDSNIVEMIFIYTETQASLDVTDATCGENDGYIDLNVIGYPPLSYQWSNSATTQDQFQLAPNTYYVAITDGHGCVKNQVAHVESNSLSITGNIVQNVCPGLTSGEIDITAVGTETPFTFQWSTGETTEDITNLGDGSYEVIVTDNVGCSSSASFDIQDPENLDVEFVVTSAGCGSMDGAIDAMLSGGTGSYNTIWRNANSIQISTAEDLVNIGEGTYTLEISDINGCPYEEEITLSEVGAPILNAVSITPAGCTNDGAIDLNITTSSTVTSVSWSNAESTEDISSLSPGNYSVAVEDNSGCTSNLIVEVPEAKPSIVDICLVTVDTLTNTNKIIWEKPVTTDIDKFIIYRESSIAGQFLVLDSVDYADESEYTDLGAFPHLRSWRYKLAVLNTCGVESEMSDPHKTIHMVINQFGQTVSVSWDQYEGFSFSTYNIYKHSNETGWQLWQQLPNNLFSATDPNPEGTNIDYVVEAVPNDPCVSAKANSYGETRSNRQTVAGGIQTSPIADFSESSTSILTGEIVTFTDESSANPSADLWFWEFEGGNPNASLDQNPIVEYNEAGTFYVKLRVFNTMGNDTITKTGWISVGDAGIDELPGVNSMMLFPNPAKENVWISFNTAETQNITLELMTLDGKLIKTQNISGNGEVKTQIDLSNVSKATYLLRIRTNEGSLMKRIVKQ